MKIKLYLSAVLSLVLIVLSVPSCGQKKSATLTNQEDSISYAIGYDVAKSLSKYNYNFNSESFYNGFRHYNLGEDSTLSTQDINKLLSSFRNILMEKRGSANKNAGVEFLKKNKEKKGVITLENGLQYEVLKSGKGKKPSLKDEVTVNYTGKFIDGRVFDSSINSDEPAKFIVERVIPGWKLILPRMRVGDKWIVYVPSELGYGNFGTPDGKIPPSTTLVFEIELLGINGK